MAYEVILTEPFERKAKRLIKKFPSLKNELQQLSHSLSTDPEQGDHLGNNCYKVRLAIKSKGKGKSGGARVITYVLHSDSRIYLIDIYDKSERSTISDKELRILLELLTQ